MPNAAPKICLDCSSVAIAGSRHCAAHQENNRAARAARERSATLRDAGLKRLYDSSDWRNQLVPYVLSRDPLCRLGIICEGRAFSTDVDHIIRAEVYIAQHGGDHTFFYDPDNLQGICHADHSHKTALENVGRWVQPVRSADDE